MAKTKTQSNLLIRDLGGGLILRHADLNDTEALVDFNARVHSDEGWEQPNHYVGAWTRDLMSDRHPTFSHKDFTIVEDTEKNMVVSSVNLISQTWAIGGIPFKLGRPELVGTHPDYRNRGLVRAQFDVIHRWSAERGELVQAITGIPYYYRLFGYEMAMDLGGGRMGYAPHIPALPGENPHEPFLFRSATIEDIPFIDELYMHAGKRYLVMCVRDEIQWRYELSGHSPQSINGREVMIITRPDGERVGYLTHSRQLWGPAMPLLQYELKPGISWLEVTPSVQRFLDLTGKRIQAASGEGPYQGFDLGFGAEHPAYQAIHSQLPRIRQPYAYYMRVPDLPRFLNLFLPLLQRRLDESIAAGHTGELKISFYRDGLRFILAKGNITTIESWRPTPVGHAGDALFPNLTFLQLVFGYRSLEELEAFLPDVSLANDPARALISVLFPKQHSDVWALS